MLGKAEARRRSRRAVQALDRAARAAASESIAGRLCALALYQRAQTVLLYASLGDEVDTAPILACCRRHGKRLALPRIDPARRDFAAALVSDPATDLLPGAWKIPEPGPHCETIDVGRIDLAIVPGRAFDRRGNRVGRGRGMYDRYLLQSALTAPVIGLAYACQVFTAGVAANPLDASMQVLITEEGVERFDGAA